MMLLHSHTLLCVFGFHPEALSYVSVSLQQAMAGQMEQMCDWMFCSPAVTLS